MVAPATTNNEVGRSAARSDRLKVNGLLWLREYHARTIERASTTRYRRRKLPAPTRPSIKPAAAVYPKAMGWLPTGLIAPDKTPKCAALPMSYYLAYYGTSKLAWTAYHKWPITESLRWSPGSPESEWGSTFPKGETGWDQLDADRAFAQLRVQGANPFLLARTEPDPTIEGEDPTSTMFEVDYRPAFDGVFTEVRCRFVVNSDGELEPTTIHIGDDIHRPRDEAWDTAKQIANGLDARYAVFGSHLFYCHLIVGQAYALSAFELPEWHELRPFLDFFTYGTLPVNDAAYKSLLTDQSYFVMSKFITRQKAPALVKNLVDTFDFRTSIAPADIERRGLAALPDHPYVHDALLAWDAMLTSVTTFVRSLYADDDAVLADDDLQRWHAALRRGLLKDPAVPDLTSVDALVLLLTALLFNNVVHEVCGNLAPLFGKNDDSASQASVNIDHLAILAAGGEVPEPSAADVFLVKQAVFVSRFNVGGNNLLEMNGDRLANDPKVQAMLLDLQARLRDVDQQLSSLDREIEFKSMSPRKWEASISF